MNSREQNLYSFAVIECTSVYFQFYPEFQVKQPTDSVLYLWKAHNVVNARLKGDNTEDPEFPKYQFPPEFLCGNCSSKSNSFNDKQVLDFLLNYYTAIKPHNPSEKKDARATFISQLKLKYRI